MTDYTKSILLRFVRGSVAGALGFIIPLLPQSLSDITSLQDWLARLAFAGFVGLITGAVLALDKVIRYKE